MSNEELAAQVSALHIQPGTVVVLSLNLDADNFETAKAMAEQLRYAIPHENKLLVLQRPAEIQALDEAQMRELGWVKSDAVNDLIGMAEISLSMLQAKRAEMAEIPAEPGVNDDTYFEYVGLGAHIKRLEKAISVAKGTQPELPL